jgi:hypothetical protein
MAHLRVFVVRTVICSATEALRFRISEIYAKHAFPNTGHLSTALTKTSNGIKSWTLQLYQKTKRSLCSTLGDGLIFLARFTISRSGLAVVFRVTKVKSGGLERHGVSSFGETTPPSQKPKSSDSWIPAMSDSIDPKHYTATEIEPIQVIEAWKLGFNLGNAIKYIARSNYKGSRKDDLIKAANYLYREAMGEWLPEELMDK